MRRSHFVHFFFSRVIIYASCLRFSGYLRYDTVPLLSTFEHLTKTFSSCSDYYILYLQCTNIANLKQFHQDNLIAFLSAVTVFDSFVEKLEQLHLNYLTDFIKFIHCSLLSYSSVAVSFLISEVTVTFLSLKSSLPQNSCLFAF